MVAGDQPRGARAGAIGLERGRAAAAFTARMVRQVQIVVAGEGHQPPPVALDPDAVEPVGRDQSPAAGSRAASASSLASAKSSRLRMHSPWRPSGAWHTQARAARKPADGAAQLRRVMHAQPTRPDWLHARPAPCLAALLPDEDRARRRWPWRAPTARASCLEDGRELVDGIASWWTACHGYNHPHIRAGRAARQLERAPHVMFGGLAHEPAYRLAERLAALLPGDLDHVFFAESGSVSVEIAMKMALQYWINRGRARPHALRRLPRRLSRRHPGDDDGLRSRGGHAQPVRRRAARPARRRPAASTTASEAALDALLDAARRARSPPSLVEPRVQGAGGMLFHDDEVLAPAAARSPTGTACC